MLGKSSGTTTSGSGTGGYAASANAACAAATPAPGSHLYPRSRSASSSADSVGSTYGGLAVTPMVPMRSVVVRILSRPVPIRIPYRSRICATTAAGSMPLGTFRHETVFDRIDGRSEEHTSELQSPCNLVCRLLLEKKKI